MRGIAWISQDRDTPDVGHYLGQQLEDLAAVVAGDVRDSGQIAARSSQTRHEARPDRIGHANHDDRGCLRHLLGCTDGRRAPRQDQIHLGRNELAREFREAFGCAIRPPLLEDEVAAFDVAEFTHCLAEVPKHRLGHSGRTHGKEPHPVGPAGGLRLGIGDAAGRDKHAP